MKRRQFVQAAGAGLAAATIAKPDSRKLKVETPALTRERRIKEGEMIKEVIEKLNTLTAPLAPAAK